MTSGELGEQIEAEMESIAQQVLERHYSRRPELDEKYGPRGREASLRDIRYHLSFLSEALRDESTTMFIDYAEWAAVLLQALGIDPDDLRENLRVVEEVVCERLPEGQAVLPRYIEPAVERISSTVPPPRPFSGSDGGLEPLAEEYLSNLLDGHRKRAMSLIMDRVENGARIEDIYLGVFQPCLHEVGRLWQINEITVAQEHFFTASTQLIMSRLYPYMFRRPQKGPSALATTVSGELHEIGVRMVADLLEMRGWDTYFLGSNTPLDSIIDSIRYYGIEVLLLSATISYHVKEVRRIIEEVRRSEGCENTKVMVGGRPFNIDRELWRKVGADGFAPDGRQAIQVAQGLDR